MLPRDASSGFWARLGVYSLLLLASSGCTAAQEVCEGALVIIATSSDPPQLLSAYPSRLGVLPPGQQPEAPLLLHVAQPEEACSRLDTADYAGAALLVRRGGCTYLEKAQHAQAANASLLLVYNSEPECLRMGVNASEEVLAALHIASVSVDQAMGLALAEAAESGEGVSVWMPRCDGLDPSAAVVWLIAMGTAVAAALWAGADAAQEAKLAARSIADEDVGLHGKAGGLEVLVVTGQAAVGFVVMASAMLLLLFFFLNHIFAVVLVVMFCFAAFQALIAAFAALFARAAPPSWQDRGIALPAVGPVDALSLAACAPAAAVVIAWVLGRSSWWAWPLQDAMGMALMLLLLRQFRLPSVKVACILLPLCFLYDIFWVFLEPRIMGGPSVMIEVATGGKTHEVLPMLLLVPRFLCGGGYTFLGFGDVVLPGLLLVYTRIFDLGRCCGGGVRHGIGCGACGGGCWGGYFVPASLGYGVGLVLTYGALLLQLGGDEGQPALLYLIPCTLGVTLALGYWRGDLPEMWEGGAALALVEACAEGQVQKSRLPMIREETEEAEALRL